jgi:hypothetical protein
MDETFTNKAELLNRNRSERELLEEILLNLNAGEMTAPELEGGWSVKDTLAHITAWEQEMIGWLRAAQRGETPERPPFGLGEQVVDQINAGFYQANRDKPLEQVLDESSQSYREALEIVEQAPKADLFDPKRFQWLEGEAFWPIVAANTCWHYEEHRLAIEQWLNLEEG